MQRQGPSPRLTAGTHVSTPSWSFELLVSFDSSAPELVPEPSAVLEP